MSLDAEYDVLVVGFGLRGAAAALGAAEAGARVLVIDRKPLRRPLRPPGRRSRHSRKYLRAAAVAAGVHIRGQSAAHELLVEGDMVRGVGFAALEPRTLRGISYHALDRVGAWTTGVSRTLGRAVTGAAQAAWAKGSSVEMVRCSAVLLGMDRSCWDFVGPAVWAVMGAAGWRLEEQRPSRAHRRLSLVTARDQAGACPTPELAVREWCATTETGRSGCLGELRVARGSGEVRVGERGAIPGLYAAVPDPVDWSPDSDDAATRLVAAARQTGAAAAAHRTPDLGRELRLVV